MCIHDEASIIFALCFALQKSLKPGENEQLVYQLQQLCPSILTYIKKFVSHTQWSVEDIRPYQTLAWVLDSEKALDANDFFRTVNCLLPRMISSYHKHLWCNTFNDIESISSNLRGPSLWNKDGFESHQDAALSPLFCTSSKCTLVANCAGPSRVKMNACRGVMFHLLQLPAHADKEFFTMENGAARRSQANSLFKLFTRFIPPESGLPLDLIKYQLSVIVATYQQNSSDTGSIIELLSMPPNTSIDISLESNIGEKLNEVVMLLVEKIQLLNVTDYRSMSYRKYQAQAWVYIGLLRLNLLLPSSPIDPGRKPATKAEQLRCVISDMSTNLLSASLHSGLSNGDFAPDIPISRLLLNLREIYLKKQLRQQKKIIERPPHSPSFYDLYRELHHFCKTSSVEKVSSLVKIVETSSESNYRSQETNWQCSAAAFCNRLLAVYSMYEDVTIPCINEIQSIQRGLRELSLVRSPSSHSRSIIQAQNSLLVYPFTHHDYSNQLTEESTLNGFDELLLQFGLTGRAGSKIAIADIVRSCHLASLFRVHLASSLDHTRSCLSSEDFRSATGSLFFLAVASTNSSEEAPSEGNAHVHESEEEREERELREYFPDHCAEFQRIITRLDEDEDYQDADGSSESKQDNIDVSRLSDQELSLAVSLHRDLFNQTTRVDDKLRTRMFVTSYTAASRIGELTNWMMNSDDGLSNLNSHIFALALRCNTNKNVWLPSLYSETTRDFHNDPFPSESIKADGPLALLLIRIAQLLRAFPGHSVLVGLGQVVERIRRLDIQVVSLGKVMSGLEVILRRAQDWEQHASQHVQLGKPLKDISVLVTAWRKLELHSWSSLLSMREKRRGTRAHRHWPRIYSLINKERENALKQTSFSNIPPLSPKWLWKGFPQIADRLGVDDNTKCIEDLAKVLDTFILTSNLAECKPRVALLESFANELRQECCLYGLNRLPLTRLMHSLSEYYGRMMPILECKKEKQREPIEKRLKDEVKLAKWDEQTYYSLVSLNLNLLFNE